MKKMVCIFLFLSIFMFLRDTQTAKGEQVIKLKVADSFPIGHLSNRVMVNFIRHVEELTNNKVKIEYYPAEQMGKLKDLLQLCSQGIVDIAYIPPSHYGGQIPLNTVITFPLFTTAVEGTEIYSRLMDSTPELRQEFLKYKVRPLIVHSAGQWDIGTVRKPVRGPEDLKGLKLRTPGGFYDKIARQYGIIGVSIPTPDVYEATQRGVVDGSIFPIYSLKPYRLYELEKYHTYGARMGGYPTCYPINEKTWEKLPEDIQKALIAAARDIKKEFSESWDNETIKLLDEFEKGGMVIHRIDPKDRGKWNAPLAGVENEWIQDLEKRGLPAKKVFEKFKKISQEVAKQ